MKKFSVLIMVFFTLLSTTEAQTPKWVEKAKGAVFSVITYDQDGNMLNTGNGFFVSSKGEALSDYTLFKGAERAEIVTSDGKQMPVDVILGVNDMYDVIRFKVSITDKKITVLTPAKNASAAGEQVWILPYSTQKSIACETTTIKEATKISGEYSYYTLSKGFTDKMFSCPVMNGSGEVIGLTQGDTDAEISYAVDALFIMSLKINALSINNSTLNSIGIRKGLPDQEQDALIYLYMASSQVTADVYEQMLNDFITQFPNSAEGYIRRATFYATRENTTENIPKADADFSQALKVSTKQDDVYYNKAKLMYTYSLTQSEQSSTGWNMEVALSNIRSAIAIQPLPLYSQLCGDILYALGNFSAALDEYGVVNASNMASPETYYSAALSAERSGADNETVIALMDSCINHCPKPMIKQYAPYLLERAQRYIDANKARLALADYDAYYNAVNGQASDIFYYYREQAAWHSHQYQRALDDIERAIELNPEELVYHTEKAVVNIRVGRYEEAAKVIETIIATDSTYGEAYRLLGLCQVKMDQQSQACDNFHKAKELGDTNADALIERYCK